MADSRQAVRWASVLILAALCAPKQVAAQDDATGRVPARVQDALSPFRANPDSAAVHGLLDRWTDFQAVHPSHALPAARLWRRAGETNMALGALNAIQGIVPSGGLVSLERARVLLESGLPGYAASGARSFWRACEGSKPALRAELWTDLAVLMTPDEREAWPDLEPHEICNFLRAAFEERAFRMATMVDERLRIHYERLREARRLYWIPRQRFYPGMSDYHGRLPGMWFDDRGLLYVRMGEPDHEEACQTFRATFDKCWVFYRPAGYKLFFLSQERRTEQLMELTPTDGDYRIQETFGPRARPGDLYFQKYVANADIPRSVRAHLIRTAGPRAFRDAQERALDRAEAGSHNLNMRLATRRFTSEALEQVPDVPAVSVDAEMRWEALRFLNPYEGRWHIWFLTSLRASELQPSAAGQGEDGTSAEYHVQARLASRAESRFRLDSASNRMTLDAEQVDEAGIPVRLAVSSAPGPIPFSLGVEDLNNRGHGSWVQDTVRAPDISTLPQLSDIAVAQRMGGSWTRDGSTFLRVTPAHITDTEGNVHVYFEAYGLPAGTEYEVELRLGRTDDARALFAESRDDLPFRLAFSGTMPGSGIGRHHLRLELGDTKPGAYTLGIQVTEPSAGVSSLPSVTPLRVADR
ncbi:MAG: hypothetical protein ABFS14_11655 [Gemmatimonadota bacterium]